MVVTVTVEHRFCATPDGLVWSKAMYGYSFWKRYLAVFDRVIVAGRCFPVEAVGEGWSRVTGDRVDFVALPYYRGPVGYLLNRGKIRRLAKAAVAKGGAFILRVPSPIAGHFAYYLNKRSLSYGVEVVGDPWDVFAKGVVDHPLRLAFRYGGYNALRKQCRLASAAAYVTRSYLQRRYPTRSGAFSTSYSSVELPPEAFRRRRESEIVSKPVYRIVSIGTLETLYKGPDVLLLAISQVASEYGVDVRLTWVGDGAFFGAMKAMADSLGIGDVVSFVGQIPRGEPVREVLDSADLFVLASKTEGLPRVVVEAMARGLPCVATNVGGVGDLLDEQYLVAAGDARALADKIAQVLKDVDMMRHSSAANFERSLDYQDHLQDERRKMFYEAVCGS